MKNRIPWSRLRYATAALAVACAVVIGAASIASATYTGHIRINEFLGVVYLLGGWSAVAHVCAYTRDHIVTTLTRRVGDLEARMDDYGERREAVGHVAAMANRRPSLVE